MSNLWPEFPQDISDEAAFHLTNIVSDFSTALDWHYYAQVHRYLKSTQVSCEPAIVCDFENDNDGETEPF